MVDHLRLQLYRVIVIMSVRKLLTSTTFNYLCGTITGVCAVPLYQQYVRPPSFRDRNGFTKEEKKINDDGFVEGERCGTHRLRQSLESAVFSHYHLNPDQDPTRDELVGIIWNTRTDAYFA
jgi:hypothetical protein